MSLDTSRIGVLAAEWMASLEESYKDYDDDVEIGEVMLLVEIASAKGDGWTAVAWRCTNPKNWVQRGLIREAWRSVKRSRRTRPNDDS